MSGPNPWRKIPAVGEWSREDAGRSGLKCPSCGADTGYVHKCVACGRLDPGDGGKDAADLADARSKPHRHLARAIQSSRPLYRTREWARGVRRLERAELWVEAAEDLFQALPDGVLEILLERLAEVDDDLPADALDSVDGCRQLQARLADAEDGEAPRSVIGWLHERSVWLRDGRQSADDSDATDDTQPAADAAGDPHATPTAAVATDGGSESADAHRPADLCPHDRADRSVDEIGGDRLLWCLECHAFVALLDENDEVEEVLDPEPAPAVDGGGSR